MAQSIEFKDNLSFPAQTVMDKMLDTDFITKWTVVQKGLNPKVVLTDKTDTQAVIDIDLEEPIPAIGTIKAHMHFTWNLETMKCEWKRSAEGVGGKSKINGTSQIIANGDDACTFVDVINIDISIPLMGKKMEKKILEYMREGRAEKMEFLTSNL